MLSQINIFAFANNPARQKRKRIQAINDKYAAIDAVGPVYTAAQAQQVALYRQQIAALGKKKP